MFIDQLQDFNKNKITTIKEIKEQELQLHNLMLLHLDKLDIANAMFCDTLLLDEYAQVYYKCSFENLLQVYNARSNAILLDKQFEKAMQGSEKLLVFLGKNYARQVDAGDKALLQAETIILTDTAIEQEVGEEEVRVQEEIQEETK